MHSKRWFSQRNALAFLSGGVIAILGGLIGLGGAEFRLPVLVSGFHFPLRRAITMNLVISLITVTFSLLFRASTIPFSQILAHTPALLNLLAGSLIGSFVGVNFATRASERVLNRAVILLLVVLSFVLIGHEFLLQGNRLIELAPEALWVAGTLAGIGIGFVSSLLGIAGGELIIPTLVLLYDIDIKLAGSLSLVISVPTILVGLIRYARKGALTGLGSETAFLGAMGAGSILGALLGSSLVRYASQTFLQIFLGLILLFSAVKLARDVRAKKEEPATEVETLSG